MEKGYQESTSVSAAAELLCWRTTTVNKNELKRQLELDRKAVFQSWCKSQDNCFGDLWKGNLMSAETEYRSGKIDYTIDFLLQNP